MQQARRAVGDERVWLTHQTHGELDDSKLVDAVCGDANVYKRSGVDDAAHFHAGAERVSDPKGDGVVAVGLARRADGDPEETAARRRARQRQHAARKQRLARREAA